LPAVASLRSVLLGYRKTGSPHYSA